MPKFLAAALTVVFASFALAVDPPGPTPPTTPDSKTPGNVDPNKPMGAIKVEDKPAVPPEELHEGESHEEHAKHRNSHKGDRKKKRAKKNEASPTK